MKDHDPLKKLHDLYGFYHQFLKGNRFSCVPGCNQCCTVNVLVTSLELEYMFCSKRAGERLIQGLKDVEEREIAYYRPATTINEAASFYLSGNEPPADTGEHGPYSCPLLDADGLCSIYDVRPFSCRAMTSTTPCSQDGEARMDPFLITVNLAMQQIIEHLDYRGSYGNLWDMVAFHEGRRVEDGAIKENKRLPGFLLTPEERGRFMAFLRRVQRELKVEFEVCL